MREPEVLKIRKFPKICTFIPPRYPSKPFFNLRHRTQIIFSDDGCDSWFEMNLRFSVGYTISKMSKRAKKFKCG